MPAVSSGSARLESRTAFDATATAKRNIFLMTASVKFAGAVMSTYENEPASKPATRPINNSAPSRSPRCTRRLRVRMQYDIIAIKAAAFLWYYRRDAKPLVQPAAQRTHLVLERMSNRLIQ